MPPAASSSSWSFVDSRGRSRPCPTLGAGNESTQVDKAAAKVTGARSSPLNPPSTPPTLAPATPPIRKILSRTDARSAYNKAERSQSTELPQVEWPTLKKHGHDNGVPPETALATAWSRPLCVECEPDLALAERLNPDAPGSTTPSSESATILDASMKGSGDANGTTNGGGDGGLLFKVNRDTKKVVIEPPLDTKRVVIEPPPDSQKVVIGGDDERPKSSTLAADAQLQEASGELADGDAPVGTPAQASDATGGEEQRERTKDRETDEHRLAKRQRQIDIGKNSDEYKLCNETFPSGGRRKRHAKTPDKYQVCSKRSFDGQIRKWRRQLHAEVGAGPVDASKAPADYLNEISVENEQPAARIDIANDDHSSGNSESPRGTITDVDLDVCSRCGENLPAGISYPSHLKAYCNSATIEMWPLLPTSSATHQTPRSFLTKWSQKLEICADEKPLALVVGPEPSAEWVVPEAATPQEAWPALPKNQEAICARAVWAPKEEPALPARNVTASSDSTEQESGLLRCLDLSAGVELPPSESSPSRRARLGLPSQTCLPKPLGQKNGESPLENLTMPTMATEEGEGLGRSVGVVSRARSQFESFADEKFVQRALRELRYDSLEKLYRLYPRRWIMGPTNSDNDAHAIKMEEGKGTGKLVILVLIPKKESATKALIVNVFRRRHKGGKHYRRTAQDYELLRTDSGSARSASL